MFEISEKPPTYPQSIQKSKQILSKFANGLAVIEREYLNSDEEKKAERSPPEIFPRIIFLLVHILQQSSLES